MPQGKSYDGVGKCIYCLDTTHQRSDEHIIPYSLNGYTVLKQASCIECQNITKKSEERISTIAYILLRSLNKFRSRSKNFKNTVPITLKFGRLGLHKTTIEVDILDAPLSIIVPQFPLPKFLDNRNTPWPESATLLCQNIPNDLHCNRMVGILLKKHGATSLEYHTLGIKVEDFANLIFKISLGFMWIVAPDVAEKSIIREYAISEKFPDYPDFKCIYSAQSTHSLNQLNRVRVFTRIVENNQKIFVGLQLFMPAPFPEYFCDFGLYNGPPVEKIFDT